MLAIRQRWPAVRVRISTTGDGDLIVLFSGRAKTQCCAASLPSAPVT
jgi:hypothetical protein